MEILEIFLIGQGYQIKTNNQNSILMYGNFTSSDIYPTTLSEGGKLNRLFKIWNLYQAEIILTGSSGASRT